MVGVLEKSHEALYVGVTLVVFVFV